jgi:signal transduction histidine kinase
MWNRLRRHLAVKLFISYLAVILIGIVVQAMVVEVVIPDAFQRHMMDMPGQGMGAMMGAGAQNRLSLLSAFRAGVNEALAVAAGAALLAAVGVSAWMSRRVVAPVQSLTQASLRIADGHYDQRVVKMGTAPESADELGQLAHAFDQMAERLEHTEQMRSQLLGDVSHELRTPLTVIKGTMEALQDGVLPAGPATFAQVEQEAERLQRLVNDLQELSRVEAGAYTLERHPLAVETLVQTAIQRLEQPFRQKQIALTTQVAPNLPAIQGDQDRLLQVLLNLLSNASQYTPAGGQVCLQVELCGGEVVISVKDNGVGIPPEHIGHLFTRFYRVDKSRSRQAGGGSGIGLTIAKHLVEAHGGRIWAESRGAGQGSTFAFAVPIHMKQRSEAA